MPDDGARPGRSDHSLPLVLMLAGVIVGLGIYLITGAEVWNYGVIPYLVGGIVGGGLTGLIVARARRR